MKSNLQDRRPKNQGAAQKDQPASPANGTKRTPSSANTSAPARVPDPAPSTRQPASPAASKPATHPEWDAAALANIPEITQRCFRVEPSGRVAVSGLEAPDALAFLCLALYGVAAEVRTEVIPEIDLHRQLEFYEVLQIAEAVVPRRVLYALSCECESEKMLLPLPGLAGLIAETTREVMFVVAAALHEHAALLRQKVIRKRPSENRAVLLAEALVMAEEITDCGGGNTERVEIREQDEHLQYYARKTPTLLMKQAVMEKVATLRCGPANDASDTGGNGK